MSTAIAAFLYGPRLPFSIQLTKPEPGIRRYRARFCIARMPVVTKLHDLPALNLSCESGRYSPASVNSFEQFQITRRISCPEGNNEMRDPFTAGLLSFLIPGVGQLYNGRILAGILSAYHHPGFLDWFRWNTRLDLSHHRRLHGLLIREGPPNPRVKIRPR